jgi:hypothetical protein
MVQIGNSWQLLSNDKVKLVWLIGKIIKLKDTLNVLI